MITSDHTLQPGIVLTHKGVRYIINEGLGNGGFGITYKATYEKEMESEESLNVIKGVMTATVAIKELFLEGKCIRNENSTISLQSLDPKDFLYFKERFLDEAKTLAKFNRIPNLLHVIDYFEANNTAYIVMEFVEGKTLDEIVKEKGPIEEKQATGYIRQIASGLVHVHKEGILHRDIKPNNIIITPDDQAVLLDFGAARGFVADQSVIHSVILTPGYAPIEQYSTVKRKRGPYTDVYALGATLCFCLTGEKPLSVYDREKNEQLDFPGVSSSLTKVTNKAMAFEPEDRYQTCETLMSALYDSLSENFEEEQVKSPGNEQESAEGKTEILPEETINVNSNSKSIRQAFAILSILVCILTAAFIYNYVSYDTIETYQGEYAIVSNHGKFGIVNRNGKEIIRAKYDAVWNFNDGLSKVLYNGKYGFIDTTGNIVVNFKYEYVSNFHDGRSVVKMNNKFGLINNLGDALLPIEYDTLSIFWLGIAYAEISGRYGFINQDGDFVNPMNYIPQEWHSHVFYESNQQNNDIIQMKFLNYWGFVNREGKVIVPLKYNSVRPFYEGLALVNRNGYYGFVDGNGKIKIPIKFDKARSFSEGLAYAEKDGKKGYINNTGNFVLSLEVYCGLDFDNGFAAVQKKPNGPWGYINKEGFVKYPFIYQNLFYKPYKK